MNTKAMREPEPPDFAAIAKAQIDAEREKEFEDMKLRIAQLEEALLAVATGKPVCCDRYGRVAPAPPLLIKSA